MKIKALYENGGFWRGQELQTVEIIGFINWEDTIHAIYIDETGFIKHSALNYFKIVKEPNE